MFSQEKIGIVLAEVNVLRNGKHADFYAVDAFLRHWNMFFYAFYDYSGWQYDVAEAGFMNALFVHHDLLTALAQRQNQV